MAQKLDYTKLKSFYDVKNLKFNSTKDINPYNGIIGQDRAQQALKFGLSVKSKGYNIYVSGPSGTGKTTFSEIFAKIQSEKESIPPDICYIYNFKNPKYPKVLKLEHGKGNEFAKDLDDLINILLNELPKAFTNKDFERKKNCILKKYQNERDRIIKKMTEDVKEQEFGTKTTNSGLYFMPIVKGEMLTEEQYNDLTEEEKDIISKKSEIVQEHATVITDEIKKYEEIMIKDIENLEYSQSLFTIGFYVSELLEKYNDNDEIISYLLDLKEDILENLENFVLSSLLTSNEDEEDLQFILPFHSRKSEEEIFSKYKVNVLVDNSNLNSAPVILDYDPTYSNLIGDIDYETEHGNFVTDFMKIKAGLLHKANGGYLILKAQDVFANSYSWECLRKVLRTGKIFIESFREYSTTISMNLIEPEPIAVDIKIILIGSNFLYDLICSYDIEFQKLFKIKVDFDYEIDISDKNIYLISGFIKNYINNNNCLDFTDDAIIKLLNYSSRLAERQDKFISQFNKITEIIIESSNWAQLDNAKIVDHNYVSKAIKEREYRLNLYEEKINNMLIDDILMINTTGKKIGQINGLSVLDMGDYIFGKPTKISATTYIGKAGIVNIEKEAKMSGNVHDKGVQVLIGYLGNVFAQEFPLSLSCRICFEQSYSDVDGDSASSTELYAILSSLSEVPINQEIAVTGSINQYGEIQPIGGVTYKIEGFFDICNKKGLTGNQGVIIPIQNMKDLVLKDEVISAVKDSNFHIYPIRYVDEGMEILTGMPYELIENKKLSKKCIKYKVIERLKKYFKNSIESIK